VSARAELERELAAGERTLATWDALFFAACKEAEDAEFYAYTRPVREEIARLKALSVDPVAEDPPLGDDYPALEHWRQLTLERGGSPLEVAAAWELTAITCARDGATDLIDVCHANAAAALGLQVAA
jgi:hypothetical protein